MTMCTKRHVFSSIQHYMYHSLTFPSTRLIMTTTSTLPNLICIKGNICNILNFKKLQNQYLVLNISNFEFWILKFEIKTENPFLNFLKFKIIQIMQIIQISQISRGLWSTNITNIISLRGVISRVGARLYPKPTGWCPDVWLWDPSRSRDTICKARRVPSPSGPAQVCSFRCYQHIQWGQPWDPGNCFHEGTPSTGWSSSRI